MRQGAMHGDVAVVIDVTQVTEFVQEMTDAGPRGTDHLGQIFLIELVDDCLVPIATGVRQHEEYSRQTLLTALKKLTDQPRPQSPGPVHNPHQEEPGEPRV